MTDLLRRYLELEARLSRWRAEHPQFTTEEAQLLDEIDDIWCHLNRDELQWLEHFINQKKPLAA